MADETETFIEMPGLHARLHAAENVIPLLGRTRRRMEKQHMLRGNTVRETTQEIQVLCRKLLCRPAYRFQRVGIEIRAPGFGENRRVVIAEHTHGCLVAYQLETGDRIGTVAHDIAEADNTICLLLTNVGKHLLEGFQVGMDVRNDGETHDGALCGNAGKLCSAGAKNKPCANWGISAPIVYLANMFCHPRTYPLRSALPVILLFVVVSLPLTVHAQERSRVQVLGADRLEGRVVGDMDIRELIGNVRLRQDNVLIYCDRATQNISRNSAELVGNVVILQDTLELRTDRGYYDGDTRKATARKGVYLNDGHVTLTALLGTYNTGSKIADFLNQVTIEDTAATITARRVRYTRDSSLLVAIDSVRIQFKDENVRIAADSVRHYADARHSYFYNEPVLWQIDTVHVERNSLGEFDSLDIDTLNIAADFMLALRDSSNLFLTEGNVRIVREDLAARSAVAHFLRDDSLINLMGEPILWYGDNQITGDSITARLSDNELRALDVIGQAFSISRSKPSEQDTLYPPDRFDQTSGKKIFMKFEERSPQRIRIEQTATSLYFLYDEGALNGVRRESSDLIIIDFTDGKVAEIRSIKGVEGAYYPEKYVTGKESSYNLDGFDWREDRPNMIRKR